MLLVIFVWPYASVFGGLFSACITNYIHTNWWKVITYPCPNINSGLDKPLLMLGHGWVITLYENCLDVSIHHPCPSLRSIMLNKRGPCSYWSIPWAQRVEAPHTNCEGVEWIPFSLMRPWKINVFIINRIYIFIQISFFRVSDGLLDNRGSFY